MFALVDFLNTKNMGTEMRIVFGLLVMLCITGAHGADTDAPQMSTSEKQIYISELQKLISDIDADILRCERTQRNWKTGTILGGIGTVATGTAAAIQAVQIQKLKKAGATEQESKEEAKTNE